MYPMKLKPIYNKTIWADHRLTSKRGLSQNGYGTSWEISAHPHADSVILNGMYAGMTLTELIQEQPHKMLGNVPFAAMLRLAYLDAAEDLSIQVHPNDAYAHAHEHDGGKTESWYILEADEGATLLAGINIHDANQIRKQLDDGTILQQLIKIPVRKGDFICIPAGMIHALGRGILALEIGQNSNTTYRFYDYGRRDAQGNLRDLHVTKCFQVADFKLHSQIQHYPLPSALSANEIHHLVTREEFCVLLIDIYDTFELASDHKRFYCISNVGSDAVIVYEDEQLPFVGGENMFLPADVSRVHIIGKTRVLISYVK